VDLRIVICMAALLPVAVHILGFPAVIRWLKKTGMTRQNYRGEEVVTGGGVLLAGSTLATLVTVFLLEGAEPYGWLFLSGATSMAAWGWRDDRSPACDKRVKGFRGHLHILFQERRLTSGLWKAAGGGITSLVVSAALFDGGAQVLISALILALSANLVNLFDLRPARAIKVFWLLLLIPLFGTLPACPVSLPWVLPVISASLLLFPHDAKGRVMLGDTGSNFLGFVAGFLLVTSVPLSVQIGVLVLFVLLHLLAERISFSRIIQSVSWLNRIDQWGRPMENPTRR